MLEGGTHRMWLILVLGAGASLIPTQKSSVKGLQRVMDRDNGVHVNSVTHLHAE